MCVLQIYICDDEIEILNFIKKEIDNQVLIQDYDMKVCSCHTNPIDLMKDITNSKTRRNLYFLDVELKNKKYDGFLLGKAIRNIDPHATIVYITSYKDLAYKTFQYHLEAFDYIVKDSEFKLRESICNCLKSIVSQIAQENIDPIEYYTFKTGEKIHHIPLNEILYIETSMRSHFVIVHALHDRIECIGSLSDIEQQLKPRFLKIHRSYIVAFDKIDELDLKNNRVWIQGNMCLVSRKMKSKLLEALNRVL